MFYRKNNIYKGIAIGLVTGAIAGAFFKPAYNATRSLIKNNAPKALKNVENMMNEFGKDI